MLYDNLISLKIQKVNHTVIDGFQRLEPYAVATVARSNGHSDSKSTSSGSLSLQIDNTVKAGIGRLSVSQNTDPVVKENKVVTCGSYLPFTVKV